MSSQFAQRKRAIVETLALPEDQYADASPKGSIDAPIRDLINEINSFDGIVTTSSCSGRISVFVDGSGRGPKGSGGKWLFVSHDPVIVHSPDELKEDGSSAAVRSWHELFQLRPIQIASTGNGTGNAATAPNSTFPANRRFVHLKFEPMILHILTAGAKEAHDVLTCAQQAGFRESGASNVPNGPEGSAEMINVAIRTTGLAFDNIVGYCDAVDDDAGDVETYISSVTEAHLDMLMSISNAKFRANQERTNRLQGLLRDRFGQLPVESCGHSPDWEDAAARRERKRAEGLRRREEMKALRLPADP